MDTTARKAACTLLCASLAATAHLALQIQERSCAPTALLTRFLAFRRLTSARLARPARTVPTREQLQCLVRVQQATSASQGQDRLPLRLPQMAWDPEGKALLWEMPAQPGLIARQGRHSPLLAHPERFVAAVGEPVLARAALAPQGSTVLSPA